MKNNVWARVFAGLVLLAIFVGIGALAYHAGYTNGLAQAAPGEQGEFRAVPYYGMHFGGMGFGLFGLLIGLFVFFLAFAALRRLIWGPRMMHGPWMHGPWGAWRGGQPGQPGDPQNGPGAPPFFEEWHRQAHSGDKKE